MSVIVSLMGGLGFFLYGMKLMSEGLQKVAGSKMRSILEVFTKNRVIGLDGVNLVVNADTDKNGEKTEN